MLQNCPKVLFDYILFFMDGQWYLINNCRYKGTREAITHVLAAKGEM